jgi:2-methylaconitate cis-trans-isomerase PrpF
MHAFRKLRCVIQRGGTSKGVILRASDVPADRRALERIVLAIFGSPDRRQIDGLGGADPLTSKVAIVGPSKRPDADVDYTFGAVSIDEPLVDFRGNCGNISAGVAAFAVDEGMVKATDPTTLVRIYNTNTGKLLRAFVPTRDGQASYVGDCRIDGVPGTGAGMLVDYSATAGSVTGKLLPTGRAVDVVDIPSLGPVPLSLVDAGNPMCFLHARTLGLAGIEGPDSPRIAELAEIIERIRGTAAAMLGMVTRAEDARREVPSIPMLALVSEPASYVPFGGGPSIADTSIDFVSRLFYMQEMHKTYAGTGTVATGAAARIPGTVVNEVSRNGAESSGIVRIGHPSGIIEIDVSVETSGDGTPVLRQAAFERTARRIMEGVVFIPESAFESNEALA